MVRAAPRRMLDGTYCHTLNCSRHADAIRETEIAVKAISKTTREERIFVARRQWDSEKNLRTFDPAQKDDEDSWWRCPAAPDHSWQAPASNRIGRGFGCPYCSGHRVCFSNSIASAPDRMKLEYAEDLNEISASFMYMKSRTPVQWRCQKQGHIWTQTPAVRMAGSDCGVCTNKLTVRENSLGALLPEIAQWLDPIKSGFTAFDVQPGSAKVAIWNCPRWGAQHSHPMKVRVKTGNVRGGRTPAGCMYCNNRMVNHTNSMRTTHPHLAEEFDTEANGITPDEIVAGDSRMWQWKCKKAGHTWSATAATRVYMETECAECGQWNTSKAETSFRNAILKSAAFFDVAEGINSKILLQWRSRKSMTVDVLGKLQATGELFVLEYDGSYYHDKAEVIERDLAKTEALLAAGYVVIRLRENQLPILPLKHPSLLQVSHRASRKPEDVQKTLKRLLSWLETR